MKREKVLITGVNGFIGQHMARYFLSKPFDILGIGRRSSSEIKHASMDYQVCNIENSAEVQQLFDQHQVHYIIHLAGEKEASISIEQPLRVMKANVFGTLNLLEAARVKQSPPLKSFLIIGTAHEYGPSSSDSLLTEQSPLQPQTPYGLSKLMCTELARMYGKLYSVPTVIARTFNLIGPGVKEGVSAQIVRQAVEIELGMNRSQQIAVGDENIARDFLDVRDAVEAYGLLLSAQNIPPGEVFNVCSGIASRIGELINILHKHAKAPFETVKNERYIRPSDPKSIKGDNQKIYMATGWQPKRFIDSSLLEMLDEFRKNIRGRGKAADESHDHTGNEAGNYPT